MISRFKFYFLFAIAFASLSIRGWGAPANDLFVDRTILDGTNVNVEGDNSLAGTESGEDTGSGNVSWSSSVWYGWTAPTNGVIHISGSTPVSNFYMSVRAYRGEAINALTFAQFLPDGGVAVIAGDTLA